MWNRTLIYLGLREEPEESYDDLPERFVPEDDPHAEHAPERPSARAQPQRDVALAGVVAGPGGASEERGSSNVRPLRAGDVHVRSVGAGGSARAAVVEVTMFDDVEAVGARYRTGQPVLFDAGDTDLATARRVVDFVSGLTYASRGSLTKVGGRAFLLVPDGVELSGEERRRLSELGYRLPLPSARSAE